MKVVNIYTNQSHIDMSSKNGLRLRKCSVFRTKGSCMKSVTYSLDTFFINLHNSLLPLLTIRE